ncbi:hypothetical protein WN48_02986 [Eufriesea mexicana]|uniref:Uncharacterized protein n=1 Tax=Eufriesea mexicana TaxID=516756 RepID=A0A310SPT0_9HYME|nr:hypothetical protein WN48_02986 [Eufriesea mexicana]
MGLTCDRPNRRRTDGTYKSRHRPSEIGSLTVSYSLAKGLVCGITDADKLNPVALWSKSSDMEAYAMYMQCVHPDTFNFSPLMSISIITIGMVGSSSKITTIVRAPTCPMKSIDDGAKVGERSSSITDTGSSRHRGSSRVFVACVVLLTLLLCLYYVNQAQAPSTGPSAGILNEELRYDRGLTSITPDYVESPDARISLDTCPIIVPRNMDIDTQQEKFDFQFRRHIFEDSSFKKIKKKNSPYLSKVEDLVANLRVVIFTSEIREIRANRAVEDAKPEAKSEQIDTDFVAENRAVVRIDRNTN